MSDLVRAEGCTLGGGRDRTILSAAVGVSLETRLRQLLMPRQLVVEHSYHCTAETFACSGPTPWLDTHCHTDGCFSILIFWIGCLPPYCDLVDARGHRPVRRLSERYCLPGRGQAGYMVLALYCDGAIGTAWLMCYIVIERYSTGPAMCYIIIEYRAIDALWLMCYIVIDPSVLGGRCAILCYIAQVLEEGRGKPEISGV